MLLGMRSLDAPAAALILLVVLAGLMLWVLSGQDAGRVFSHDADHPGTCLLQADGTPSCFRASGTVRH